MSRIFSLLILFSLFFLQGCGGNPTDESLQFGNPSLSLLQNRAEGESVSFNQLRLGVLFPDCYRCHSTFSKEEELKKYFTPGLPEQSLLYTLVASGKMPKGGGRLAEWKISLIRDFIAQQKPPQNIPPLGPHYSSLKIHLFDKSCVACHNPQTVDETYFDLTTYFSVRASLLDIEDSAIRDTRMPKAPIPPLTPEVKQAFLDWVAKGAPDD